MEKYVNDNNLFDELRITGDKINRTMLSKLVILLFNQSNYKKLIEFRFSVLKKNNSEYWCEVNSENFRPLLRLLEQLLGENYLHFQNLLLKPHNMSLEYNTSSDFGFHLSKDILLNKLMFNTIKNSEPNTINSRKTELSKTDTESLSCKTAEENAFQAVKYPAPVHYEKAQAKENDLDFVHHSYMKLLDLMGINGIKNQETLPPNNPDKSKIDSSCSKTNKMDIENPEQAMVNELENTEDTKQNYIRMFDSLGVIIKNFTMLQNHIKKVLEDHNKVRVVCVEDLSNIDLNLK